MKAIVIRKKSHTSVCILLQFRQVEQKEFVARRTIESLYVNNLPAFAGASRSENKVENASVILNKDEIPICSVNNVISGIIHSFQHH